MDIAELFFILIIFALNVINPFLSVRFLFWSRITMNAFLGCCFKRCLERIFE